jgi:hypothetical protein
MKKLPVKKLCSAAVLSLGVGLFSAMPAFAQIDMGQAPPLHQRGDVNTGGPNVIAADTQFEVQLEDTLDSNKVNPGKNFKAKLAQDLVAPDGTTIPMGSKIKGHVSEVDRGLHGQLLLSFDQIQTRHGWVPLAAMVTGVPGEHSVASETGPEGEIKHTKVDSRREIESAAAGAGLGAIAGAAAAGGRGAAIGAAIGGGLGTGAGFLTGRNIRLNKGQLLDLRLERDIFLPRG